MGKITVLNCMLKAINWQGGTIHQVKNHFIKADMKTKDKMISACMRHYESIRLTDQLDVLQWFTKNRLNIS